MAGVPLGSLLGLLLYGVHTVLSVDYNDIQLVLQKKMFCAYHQHFSASVTDSVLLN